MPARIQRLLIANRGEIARRVARSARALGISTVAVYSSADRDALFVKEADLAIEIGPPAARDSYLSIERIVAAALASGADAVHPGYGFLSENAAFAQACVDAGLIFVGPAAAAIASMSDKALAKRQMSAAGVPCLSAVDSVDDEQGDGRDAGAGTDAGTDARADAGASMAAGENLIARALSLGLPLMIKARAGGGGRGMRVVERAEELAPALASAQSEARASFGDGRVLIERALVRPRHIEVQVFGDQHGQVVCLGERDCSIQRRHQKLIEETPAPGLSAELRAKLFAAATTVARSVSYSGAGTVEFLLESDGSERFYFMEMNTRLQVEHTVTEGVTGLDLVALQLRVAMGERLADLLPAEGVVCRGHAIEARLCAEDASRSFLPATGEILAFQASEAVRNDHGIEHGTVVSSWYDSLLGKVIAHGDDRETARRRLVSALDSTVLLGVKSNRAYLAGMLEAEAFVNARLSTDFVALHAASIRDFIEESDWAAAALVFASGTLVASLDRAEQRGWFSASERTRSVRLAMDGVEREFLVQLARASHPVVSAQVRRKAAAESGPVFNLQLRIVDRALHGTQARTQAGTQPAMQFGVRVTLDGLTERLECVQEGNALHFQRGRASAVFVDCTLAQRGESGVSQAAAEHRSPIAGRVVATPVALGDSVARNQVLVVVEAMKMETPVLAQCSGRVTEFRVAVGQQLSAGQVIAHVSGEIQ